jgi:hypothetical protein
MRPKASDTINHRFNITKTMITYTPYAVIGLPALR